MQLVLRQTLSGVFDTRETDPTRPSFVKRIAHVKNFPLANDVRGVLLLIG